MRAISKLYERLVFQYSLWVVLFLVLTTVVLGTYSTDFELDTSAESLVLEGDQDLKFYRAVQERYATNDFLFVTFTPEQPLFSAQSLKQLKALRDELKGLPGIASVTSILDVPLLENPPADLSELVDNVKTLEHPDADPELAQKELSTSPLFNNLLINIETNTAAIQLNFPIDMIHQDLIKHRNQLREEEQAVGLNPGLSTALTNVNSRIKTHNISVARERHRLIQSVRDVIVKHKEGVELFLGGVPMVADDMVTFIEKDLVIFGAGVFLFLVITLSIIFRHPRWVFIAMTCCIVVLFIMTGLLGLLQWQVTIISSNFISLLLIITISLTIHLMVRYREFLIERPKFDQKTLLKATLNKIFLPCFYTALTTIVAFASLVVSGIRPVINFGWMMTLGICVAFVVVFLLFPALSMLVGKAQLHRTTAEENIFTAFFARITTRFGNGVLLFSLVLAIASGWGISKLVVENSFINYFDEKTEIYQGMLVIDQRLGGTTPLDVVVRFPAEDWEEASDESVSTDKEFSGADDEESFDDDFEGGFDDGFGEEEDSDKYWFTTDKVDRIKQVHAYVDSLPQIGKVVSFATMIEVAETLNGAPLTNVELALLYSAIPDEFKELILKPYISVENNEARISMRIIDSDLSLNRNALLQQIQNELHTKLGLDVEEYKLSGMMVLYNNMLQSLFQSQIMTLGFVFVGIMLMFLVLFRSFIISIIAVIPNILAAAVILGAMGWTGVPLDMMTITIAAITIGIGVDFSIHYIHRFSAEFPKDCDYKRTLHRCHGSIGRAVFYTALTIVAGFSILAMSNFIPTIYFGVLTSLAMIIALIAALTLLPQLIVFLKPFGPELKCSEGNTVGL